MPVLQWQFVGIKDNPWGSFIAMSYWLSKEILALPCYILIVKSLYIETMHWIFITYTETKVIEDRVIAEKQKNGKFM